MKELSWIASFMGALTAAAGAATPLSAWAVHATLFDACFAFALIAILAHSLPPSGPHRVPVRGG